jgi:hypothetical protein
MKLKKMITMCLIMGMISIPSLVGTQNVKAQISPGDISGILESLVKLFCPETPQKRCKQNTCQPGACISFRKACTTDSDCKSEEPPAEVEEPGILI